MKGALSAFPNAFVSTTPQSCNTKSIVPSPPGKQQQQERAHKQTNKSKLNRMSGSHVLNLTSWSLRLLQKRHRSSFSWKPHQWPGGQKENTSMQAENMTDLTNPYFVWCLWEGRYEWLWATWVPSLYGAPLPKRCTKWSSGSCWVETSDVWVLSHCARRKAPYYQNWNLSPLLHPVPVTPGAFISLRTNNLKCKSLLVSAVGLT